MIAKRHFTVCVGLLLLSALAQAANLTVKPAGGGSFLALQDCAKSAVAGDTCDAYTGSYSGWTQTTNGAPAKLIVFQCHSGETCTITGPINIDAGYIQVTGMTMAAPLNHKACGSCSEINIGDSTHVYSNNVFTYNTCSDSCVGMAAAYGVNNTIIAHNTANMPGYWNDSDGVYHDGVAFSLHGDHNLIEWNTVSNSSYINYVITGKYNVFRHNQGLNTNGRGFAPDGSNGLSDAHIGHDDFVFGTGTASSGQYYPGMDHTVYENNVWKNCTNDAGYDNPTVHNCKYIFERNVAKNGLVFDTVIARFNYGY